MNFVRQLQLYCLCIICVSSGSVALSPLTDQDELQLIDFYGGVEVWTNFSSRYDISRKCAGDDLLRVAYFTRHEGTRWDFVSVAEHLGFPWSTFNPKMFQGVFGSGHGTTDFTWADLTWQAFGQMMCHIADILMFGDLLAYAWPVLQGNCTTPIIMHVTNRFNLNVKHGDHKYLQLMKDAVTWPHVWWVSSNPYEKLYMESYGIQLPRERTLMLRPVGIALVPRPSPVAYTPDVKSRNLAVVRNPTRANGFDYKLLIPWLQEMDFGELVDVLPLKYGGPYSLADYRGVLHIPYQVSVTEMYEGLAAGVVFVLPSMSFFQKLLQEYDNDDHYRFCCRDFIRNRPDYSWANYMDWYHPDFRSCHMYFDSWEELQMIIEDRGEHTWQLFEDKKIMGKQTMKRIRAETTEGYGLLFKEIKRKACADNGKPGVWSGGAYMAVLNSTVLSS